MLRLSARGCEKRLEIGGGKCGSHPVQRDHPLGRSQNVSHSSPVGRLEVGACGRWRWRIADASIAASAAFVIRAGLFKDEPAAANPPQVAESDAQRRRKIEEDRKDRVRQRPRVRRPRRRPGNPFDVGLQARQAGWIRNLKSQRLRRGAAQAFHRQRALGGRTLAMDAVALGVGRLIWLARSERARGRTPRGIRAARRLHRGPAFLELRAGRSQRVGFQEGRALKPVLGKSPLEDREVSDHQAALCSEE